MNIDNVVREPRVAFFRLLKLGAFLAVPVTYQSVLHEGSVVGTDVNESSKVQVLPHLKCYVVKGFACI